ncbi:hypothetical protein WUBG_18733 [Wuchereria bancrofti]|uniref:Immunoglobulin I-set domain-containing protein n=1 Tax=Wuchereria bancrofti TaxID=6293 RepID=J9A8T1_WUCBA|nr:hypothetical protein WUBG_18733 [Wuchereria bancrofti]
MAKNDSMIDNTAKTHLYANGTLMIIDVNMQDEGIYHCHVQTSGGHAEAVMHLHVIEAPKVQVIPQQLHFTPGQSFNVSCFIDGKYFS